MNFLNPLFLSGLLAAAIPLIIHFINLRRPKKVAFSTLSFINKLRESTIRRIRIKQYLLMALRVLAIVVMALALARPYIPPTHSGGTSSAQPQVAAFLIDNSSSTGRIASGGPLIEQAINIAERIIDEASPADRFIIATTNGSGLQSELVGREKARALLQDIEAVPAGNYTADRYRYLREAMKQSGFRSSVMYVISDGQQSQFEQLKEMEKTDAQAGSVQFIKLQQSGQQNTSVGDISLKSQIIGRGSPVTLEVEVVNQSTTPAVNQFVSLMTDGLMAGQYALSLDAGQRKSYLFEVKPGTEGDLVGEVVLEGDEVPFDNRRYVVVRIPEARSVLLVQEPEASASRDFDSYLAPALQAAGTANARINLSIKQPDEIDSASLADYDAVIVNGLREIPAYWFTALQQHVQNGNGLLFFPSEQGNIENYNRFLSALSAGSFTGIAGEYASFNPITRMEQPPGHPILEGLFKQKRDEPISVDQPALYFYYRYGSAQGDRGVHILQTETGNPLLVEHGLGEGKLLVSIIGTDPGWSNFPVNPLFAPFYYRSTLYVASGEQGALKQHQLGEPFTWQTGVQTGEVLLTLNDEEVKPETRLLADGLRLRYPGREWTPGMLQIKVGETQTSVAVNQDIMESDFNTLTEQNIEDIFSETKAAVHVIEAAAGASQSISRQLETANFGKEIWNWFLWVAFVLLILETIVAKLYKAETIS